MPSIFDPIQIGELQLPHRLVRSATHLFLAEEDGTPNEAVAGVYRALCDGGAGLMMSGYTYATPEGQSSPRQVGIHEDRFIPAWRTVLERISPPAVLLMQLNHGGRQIRPAVARGQALAPSAVPCEGYKTRPRAMGRDDLRRIRRGFLDGAVRAMEAGFAGVQLHAAHGFLLSQFISPFCNRRTDDYGGSTANRTRFLVEIVEGIRDRLGSAPLQVKLNATDGHEAGLQLDEAVEVAARLAEAGVEAIEVSGGCAEARKGATRKGRIRPGDEGYYLEHAATIRRAVEVPVIATGGFRSRAVMEAAVADGRVDMVGLCRPFIREPDLVQRLWEGAEACACVSCNLCYQPPQVVTCRARGKGVS